MEDEKLEAIMDKLYPVQHLMSLDVSQFAMKIAEANGFIKGLYYADLITLKQTRHWQKAFTLLTYKWGEQNDNRSSKDNITE